MTDAITCLPRPINRLALTVCQFYRGNSYARCAVGIYNINSGVLIMMVRALKHADSRLQPVGNPVEKENSKDY